jgi:hypothetical protein
MVVLGKQNENRNDNHSHRLALHRPKPGAGFFLFAPYRGLRFFSFSRIRSRWRKWRRSTDASIAWQQSRQRLEALDCSALPVQRQQLPEDAP